VLLKITPATAPKVASVGIAWHPSKGETPPRNGPIWRHFLPPIKVASTCADKASDSDAHQQTNRTPTTHAEIPGWKQDGEELG
jgi:hypothetical protein